MYFVTKLFCTKVVLLSHFGRFIQQGVAVKSLIKNIFPPLEFLFRVSSGGQTVVTHFVRTYLKVHVHVLTSL
jgi:hypothetical protein